MMVQTWLFPEYLDTACVWCLLCFFSPLFNTFPAHFYSSLALILGYLMAVFSPNIFTQQASVSVWRLPHQQHPLCSLKQSWNEKKLAKMSHLHISLSLFFKWCSTAASPFVAVIFCAPTMVGNISWTNKAKPF